MPQLTYTEAEVEAIRQQERRATARAAAEEVRDLVRREVERVSRRRMTLRQAAAYLSIGVKGLRQLANGGRIRFEDRGGSVGYLFDRDDLDALAAELAEGTP